VTTSCKLRKQRIHTNVNRHVTTHTEFTALWKQLGQKR